MSSLIIVSTIICFSEHLVPVLIKCLVQLIYYESKIDIAYRDEMRRLEKEMAGLSAVDEFAKFARLQRRHAKIKDELKLNLSKRLALRSRTQTLLTFSCRFITIIISLIMMYLYAREPVIFLPQKLLWPCEKILSWPGSSNNAVSLTAWMVLTRMVVNTFKKDSS